MVGALTSRMQGSSGWAPYNETEHIIPDEVGTLTTAWGDKNYANHQEVMSGSILPDVPGTPITPEVSGTVTSKWSKGSGGPAGSSTEVSNLVGQWWDGEPDAATLTSTSDAQRMPDKDRLQAVVVPQAFNLMPESGQGADLTAIPTDHSPAFVSTYPADRGIRVVEQVPEDTYRKVSHGEYVEDTTSSTVAARDYKDSTDLVVPQAGKNPGAVAFRKSRRAQSSEDVETWVEDGDANTLNVFDLGDTRTTHAVVEPWAADEVETLQARSYKGLNHENARDGHAVVQPIPIQDTREIDKKQTGVGVGAPGDPAYTLDTVSRGGVAEPRAFDEMNFSTSEDHQVLRAGTQQSTGVLVPAAAPGDVESLTPWPEMGEAMRVYGDSGPGPALKRSSPNVLQSYGVRRLTPVECERLQAFPDGWTEPSGSDSARYKALGNAITVNVAQWLFGRILEDRG